MRFKLQSALAKRHAKRHANSAGLTVDGVAVDGLWIAALLPLQLRTNLSKQPGRLRAELSSPLMTVGGQALDSRSAASAASHKPLKAARQIAS
jgi:hypothetical protein